MANKHPVTIVELLNNKQQQITITNTPTNKTGTTIRLVQQPEPTNNKNSHYKLTYIALVDGCSAWDFGPAAGTIFLVTVYPRAFVPTTCLT